MQVDRTEPRRRGKSQSQPPMRAEAADRVDEEADRFVARVKAFGPEAQEFVQRLLLAKEFRLWADCPREVCRRARACRGDNVDCLDERHAEVTRLVLHHVAVLLFTAGIGADALYDYLESVGSDEAEDAAPGQY